MDGSCIFIFSLDFSLELLVHIFNPLLNILSRCCISLSEDQDVVMGIPQNMWCYYIKVYCLFTLQSRDEQSDCVQQGQIRTLFPSISFLHNHLVCCPYVSALYNFHYARDKKRKNKIRTFVFQYTGWKLHIPLLHTFL